jgi:hypothetical protein
MKIRPVEVEMLHAEKRRTYWRADKREGVNNVSAFRNLANAPRTATDNQNEFSFN